MKNKILFIFLFTFTFFCFFIFLKGLNNSKIYVPNENSYKEFSSFKAKKLFNNEELNSDSLFDGNKLYLFNIWASWCAPCRDEHDKLMHLSNNSSIKIIGINYRDNLIKAKKFINKFGNPYSEIVIDKDGTIGVSLGAYGIPETYVVDRNKKILKKYLGALDLEDLKEIENLLK